MLENKLTYLNRAVDDLTNSESLSILNIDEDLLESPTTTLEYVERCHAWIRLRNIAKSIPDLLGQSNNIALIGFLGHFSSGKSSLINALLEVTNIENPGYKREVGLHPTDTGITITTHRDHAHLVKKSAYTAIDNVQVIHGPALEFLEHAALVDTPGLGNEAAEHEAVTRFLHLCHVLVITIDGRRPFADKDKDFDLLNTAFNKLSGVPKILVITSAEEFLTSRMGNFCTDWQSAKAESFWNEAIERLKRDPRFQDHLQRFQTAPRFFVDSKEGFRVEEVKNELLPIVTGDAQRSRIRQAQGQYVLSVAAEALNTLLAYITTRSENLNRLLEEAQGRADGTTTAVDQILESLNSSFDHEKQKLQEVRQHTPSGNFRIEEVVTPQSISSSQGAALSSVEGKIREATEQQLQRVRGRVWYSVHKYSKARTRRWFPRAKELNSNTVFGAQFGVGEYRSELGALSMKCAQAALRAVNQQIAGTFANMNQYIQRRTEAWEIGSRQHAIEVALEHFGRVHDDSIKSFYAYISAPSSIDLLREHGFVGFNEFGGQAVQTESVNSLQSSGFLTIHQAAEKCKDRLRALEREERAEPSEAAQDEEAWLVEDTELGDGYFGCLVDYIEEKYRRELEKFVSRLKGCVEEYEDNINIERRRVAELRGRIWKARMALTIRVLVVTCLMMISGLLFEGLAPSQFRMMLEAISQDLIVTAVVGVVSTIFVLLLSYVIVGARNRGMRLALQSILVERAISCWRRRGLGNMLREKFDEHYGQLVTNVGETPLELDEAVANGVIERVKKHSQSYQRSVQVLEELREAIEARSEIFDQYVSAINQRLSEIPNELRGSSDRIKESAIEEHLDRIRKAVEKVERVRSQIQAIADIAMSGEGRAVGT